MVKYIVKKGKPRMPDPDEILVSYSDYLELKEQNERLSVFVYCLVSIWRERINNIINIMDEKGKRNAENNSRMLWYKDWDFIRNELWETQNKMDEIIKSDIAALEATNE